MLSILRRARRTNATANSLTTMRSKLLLALVLALSLCGSAAQAQVDVTATAGNTGPVTYATLQLAFAAVNDGTHQGVVTMAVTADTTETATAVLNASGAGAAVYTSVTVSPSGGAARTISGAIVAGSPLIDLNGADNVTIDGLNTGGNSLTISNTTASATSGTSTIRFLGGATNNVITNSSILGSSSSSVATNGGTIFFSTDAVTANGNDNNTISNNNIGPAGVNLPSKAILGNGSTTTTALGNSGILINNNNIFDYFAAAVTSSGIAVNGGCNAWSITNNRFYQTATRTWTTGAVHRAIDLNSATATSGVQAMTVTGNIVGYATDTQTGTYTLTGSTGKFQGIQFNGITGGTVSNINSNTIAAVSMAGVTSNGTGTSSPFLGILVTNGLATTNSNIIGSQSATGSLALSTTTTSATDVYGIYNFSFDDWTANSNNIGGISVTNLGASGTFVIYGLRANTSTAKLFNAASNNIGGTVAGSIQLTSTGAASQVIGMLTSNAISTWTSNVVRNLTNNNGTGTTTGASVIGMSLTTTTPNQTVTQNTIRDLSNSNATAATVVTGIQFTGGTANVVARNLIYGLTTATNSTAAEVNGIRVAGGTTVYRNNMIAVGAGIANAIGTGSTTGGVNGINEPLGTDSFFHNSVYVGGAPTAGVGPSYAFNSSQTVNTRSFRDNIFFNARSNSGATGKNYAVRVGGTAPNPGGLTINNNLYFANGTGAVFGFFNSLDVANLAAWKVAVGQDAFSYESNPQYLDPTNATPDLHLHPSNPTVAEGNGSDVGVTDDFDGQTRSGLTPVDIGADAGNFVGIDLAPPVITFTTPPNTTSTANVTLATTITDLTGVPTAGVGLPVIYYRKNADPFVGNACSFVSGASYNCVLDYSLLVGGVVTAGDVLQFYVAAQDTLGNVTSNPSAGAGGYTTNPPAAATPPTTPASYRIALALTGSLTVGSGGGYPSLTNPGGLFEAINNNVLTGSVIIDILSDLAGETGTVALNQWTEEGAGGYTFLLRPSGVARTVSGSSATALIKLAGADRVTIDGSLAAGTDRSLSITNAGTGAIIWIATNATGGANNDTIKNCNLTGPGAFGGQGIIAGSGTTFGNPAEFPNSNNTIQNNAIKSVQNAAFISGEATTLDQNWLLTQNDVGSATAAEKLSFRGFLIGNAGNFTISQNVISGISSSTSTSATMSGIQVASNINGGSITRNQIRDIRQTNTTGWGSNGILLSAATTASNLIISNNFISDVASQGFNGVTATDNGYGIMISTGGGYRILHNSVLLNSNQVAGTGITAAVNIAAEYVAPASLELRDNILASTQTVGTRYGVLDSSTAGAAIFSTINHNDYFAQNVGFLTSAQATLGAWQTVTGQDANSLAVDPLLVTVPAPADLHLQGTSPMLNAGVALAAVTIDIDGEARPVTTPDIGADEIVAGVLAFSSATYSDGESAGTTTITVTRTGGSTGAVSIDYATVGGGSATGGASCGGSVDFVDASGTLNFPDSNVSQSFTVTLCPDALNEANETVNLALSNPLGGSILGTPNTAVLTINDDDPAPTISITDVTQAELDSGTSLFGFVVSLSAPSGQTVTVHVQTADGTATIANNDYVAIPDTILTFNPGVTTANVDVTVNGDTAPEVNETFFVNLATATNASILDNQGVGTITNDDPLSGPVTVTATAGTPGPTDYPTLKAAFDAINAGTHQGAISIEIVTSVVETATAALNASGSGAAVYTSVVVRPSNPGVSVTGSIVGAIIKLNGADNVTIDGRVGGIGTARSLTVQNTNTSAATAAIWVSSNGAGAGASNNVIRNLEIACGADQSAVNTSTFGIIMSGATISTTSNGDDNDNNQFIFNRIVRARYGIVTRGVTTNLNVAPVVTDNIVGPAAFGADQIGKVGIFMQADTGATVARNVVQFVGCLDPQACTGADRVGIAIGTESWSMAPGTITSNSYTVTRNVIHDVIEETTFSGVGMILGTTGGGVATNNLVANNFIYNVRANGTSGDQAVGLGISGGHTDVVVNNSIAMTGDVDPGVAGASTNFGSGIRIANASSASHANLTLRNNSVYMDLSSSSTAANRFYAISGNAAGYAFGTGGENFNNYYINPSNTQLQTGGLGTTSGSTLTTQFATLALWQAAYTAPQDANSIQANPAYFSPTGDLHIGGASPNIDTATTVAAVTVDIDNEARPNGAAYDIGADEFYPQPGVLQLSSATYSGNEGTTLVVTVNRVLGDSGTVGATYTLANGSATGGAACGVGVDFVDPGPQLLSFGNLVTSQPINVTLCSDAVFDAAETFTITLSLPTGGATLGSPTVATASIVNIAPPFSGSFSVGSGQNYTSLTNPGGIFEAINLSGAAGNVTIDVTSDLTGETGTVPLNELAGAFTVTLKPSGAARAITGSAATSLIKLAGADNVTIDGSLAAGTDRSLTITNTGAGAIVWIATNATSGANNDTIKNCNLTGPGAFAGQGIIAGSGATFGGAAEFPNSNNTIQNNAIKSVQNAAFISGEATTLDQNWLLTQNDVGSATAAEKLAFRGFLIGNAGNFTISRNVISGVSSSPTSSSTMSGIQVAAAINGGSITGNRISNIRQNNTAGWGSNGILLGATTTASNVTISNNFISDVASQGFADVTAADNGYGIMVNSGGGYSIVANSILLNTDQVAVTGITAAVNIAAAVVTPASIELRDNVLASTQTLGTRYGVLDSSTAGAAIFSTINHNDYFAQNVGFLTSAQATLGAWQTATGQDANSLAVDPLFVTVPAPADLHLQGTSPMLNAGVALAAVTVDIDNDPRPPATPDIGADELVQADLSVTKTDGVGSVTPGGSTTYTIVASNAGAHNVTGATVADTLPATLTCNWTCSGTLGGTCTAAGSGNINDTVNLPAGGSVTYTVSCAVSPSASGSIVNTATVSSATADPNAANDSATDTDTVGAPSADLSITKTDGSASEIPGTSVVYTIVASNAGPSPAATATVSDTFAGVLSGCSTTCVGSGGGTCTAGPVAGNLNDTAVSLPVGASVTYTATCNIASTATGSLVNTATVSSATGDPNSGNNSATDTDTLNPSADVAITKTDGVSIVAPGSAVTYTIVATNAGPSAAPTVTVADTFVAALTGCSTTCIGSGGASCAAGPILGNLSTNANLPVGGTATYTAVCNLSITASGTLANTATATVGGGVTDPASGNNSATDTDTVDTMPFVDGFESGNTSRWTFTVPLTFEEYAVLAVDAGASEATFAYDFSAVEVGRQLTSNPIAILSDATGEALARLVARRTAASEQLELSLEVADSASSWVAVGEIAQQVRIEWSGADASNQGHVAVYLDGRLAFWVDGFSTGTPASVNLLRAPVPSSTVAP